MSSFIYGKTVASVSAANGVKGVILRNAFDGSYYFRVYHGKGKFTDYDLRHDDLEVTISPDEMASFYLVGNRAILDHSPAVLGLKKAGHTRKRSRNARPSTTASAPRPR